MCGAGIGPISTIIGKVVTWIAQLNQCYTLSTYIALQVKSNLMADEPITRESILDGQIQALAETRSHRLRVMTDDERIEMVQSFSKIYSFKFILDTSSLLFENCKATHLK